MNYALIFAGGVGLRMNSKALPKQFLQINSKPIIIHTIEHFDEHPEIDAICVVCVSEWLDHMRIFLEKYNIRKVCRLVAGGKSALESQYLGLKAIGENAGKDDIVLIHDGVRPMVDEKTITECIASVRKYGSGVCVAPATETVVRVDDNGFIQSTVLRSECMLARAPQAFYLPDILRVHDQAVRDQNHNFIDSTTMMLAYHEKVHIVQGSEENLKVTTPADFYICKALLDAKESSQLYGL